ncbi:MAG: NAD(P)H-dependent oxidoreductase [Chloroflexi bacterium]|nr:NAD(P)H-dependent oxidoreductase [Chloroflexota bacterium]
MSSVLGIVGNPRPGSRTLGVVDHVGATVASAFRGSFEGSIDLVTLGADLFVFGSAGVTTALERVMRADVLVVGSPVYKAAYTGVLKAFCDHIAAGQLAGKFAVPLMVGGSLQHYLALDVHLRPLLVELGATCATPGLYVVETELEQLHDHVSAYVEQLEAGLAEVSRLSVGIRRQAQ